MDENTGSNSGIDRKITNLDDMSLQELKTKCKNLLVIAKKAKAAKDETIKEIQSLKEEMNSHDSEGFIKSIKAKQEIIDHMSQIKLEDSSKIEELSLKILTKDKSIKDLEDKLSKFQTAYCENESLKQQILDTDTSMSDLKKTLDLLTKENIDRDSEIKAMKELLGQNSSRIKNLIQENSDLKSHVDSLSTNDLPMDQVKLKYNKVVKKLKIYRDKIFEISEKLDCLKEDKKDLLSLTNDYSENVYKWHKEIANVSNRMVAKMKEDRQKIAERENQIEILKFSIEELKTSKQKELELLSKKNEITVSEMKNEVENLQEQISSKEKALKLEMESQKKLKQAVRKTSVLDLEIEAYEKTLDELNKKLEAKKLLVLEHEQTIKHQYETMEVLKTQISSLEYALKSEKNHSDDIKKTLSAQQDSFRKCEHDRTEMNLKLTILNKNYEALKLESNESKLEMAKKFENYEEQLQCSIHERDELTTKNTLLEIEVDKFRKLVSNLENEIDNVRSEYTSYKIRAQSVLRQNQSKDINREQELQDEILTLLKTVETSNESCKKLSCDLESLTKKFNYASEEKHRLQDRCKELLTNLEKQRVDIMKETEERIRKHDESIKAYQIQIETLNKFYKKLINEKEEHFKLTVDELQTKIQGLEKSCSPQQLQESSSVVFESNIIHQLKPNDEHKLNLLLMDREEAEGSEDQSSQSSTFHSHPRRKISRGRELMPLNELLNNSSFDDNSNEIFEETTTTYLSPLELFEQTKIKLNKEENRVNHLTTLLADAEKDLARMQQLNEMLKEDIRRQQRNFDRQEHLENSEYLKNIVVKFCTLNNNDEKQRLIPVLDTILKLSSEESTLLQNTCKSGWAGFW